MKVSVCALAACLALCWAAAARGEARLIAGASLGARAAAAETTEPPLAPPSNASDPLEAESYDAMCLISRSALMLSAPTVNLFPAREHLCDGQLGCQANFTRLALEDEEELDDGQLRAAIQRQLLDTGLYNASQRLHLLIHGFLADWQSAWMCRLKDQILDLGASNVLIVDWSGGSKPLLPIDYGLAVANTRPAARALFRFLSQLLQATGQQPSQLTLVGHSLGAHISGLVGLLFNGQLGAVVGLDPAGPCFASRSFLSQQLDGLRDSVADVSGLSGDGGEGEGDAAADADSNERPEPGAEAGHPTRLSAASARHVLAVHTDTATFGLNENCAQADIYVNGGRDQPACQLVSPLDLSLTCAHSFAHRIFQALLPPEAPTLLAGGEAACYPMGFRCHSWLAFKRGECGVCQRAHDCAFMGLSLGPSASSAAAQPAAAAESPRRAWADPAPGRLFIKTAEESPHCAYHYQAVLALAQPASAGPFRPLLYLELEYREPGAHAATSRHFKLANEVHPGGHAFQRLRAEYARPLAPAAGPKAPRQFYTALITLDPRAEPLDEEACETLGGPLDPEASLCAPLGGPLQAARLWVQDDGWKPLGSVLSLDLNYMSALNESARAARSLRLVPAGGPVRTKGRASAGRTFGLLTKAFKQLVLKPLDCTLHNGPLDVECQMKQLELARLDTYLELKLKQRQ